MVLSAQVSKNNFVYIIIIFRNENAEQIQNSINNNDKEYETFTHQKATKESSNHSNSLAKNTRNEEEENINELENLLTTISARNENKSIESSETSITQSDAEENVTTEEIPKNAENATTVIQPRIGGPNSLGLTSDSHVKRGVLPQLSNDDGKNNSEVVISSIFVLYKMEISITTIQTFPFISNLCRMGKNNVLSFIIYNEYFGFMKETCTALVSFPTPTYIGFPFYWKYF